MKFTDTKVASLKPTDQRYEVFEGGGFGIRVSPSGKKVFILLYRYRGKSRRLTIGEYLPRVFGLADARLKAAEAKLALKMGKDPAWGGGAGSTSADKCPTVSGLSEEYVQRWAKPRKVSWKEDQRMLEKDVLPVIGEMMATDVTRRDIIMVLDRITDRGAMVTANRVAALLSKMFNFAVDRGIVDASPCLRLPSHAERPRARTLTDDEIRLFWAGVEGAGLMSEGTRLALKLVLVTGQRPGEVCGMGKQEIQESAWIIPACRIKTRHKVFADHRVPLSPMAMEIIEEARQHAGESSYLFPSPFASDVPEKDKPMDERSLSRAIRRNRPGPSCDVEEPAFPFPAFTPHDLRRTCRTKLAELGVPDIVAERILNHTLQGMARVYNRHGYDEEKREALNTWAGHLRLLVAGAVPANVIALRQ